jgi:hypothetical protein
LLFNFVLQVPVYSAKEDKSIGDIPFNLQGFPLNAAEIVKKFTKSVIIYIPVPSFGVIVLMSNPILHDERLSWRHPPQRWSTGNSALLVEPQAGTGLPTFSTHKQEPLRAVYLPAALKERVLRPSSNF